MTFMDGFFLGLGMFVAKIVGVIIVVIAVLTFIDRADR